MERALAEKFIEKLTQYTEYNINIMDEKGMIIASKTPERIGTFHEIAYDLMVNHQDQIEVWEGEGYLGAKQGINIVIVHKNQRVGVIGITGNPDEVRPIGLILKMSIEATLEYEDQLERVQKRRGLHDQFIHLLLYEVHPSREELKLLAHSLDYDSKTFRVPILLTYPMGIAHEKLVQEIRRSDLHRSQDIIEHVGEGRIVIFKALDDIPKDQMIYEQSYIEEYIHEQQKLLEDMFPHILGKLSYYVGVGQNRWEYYGASLEHCFFLQRQFPDIHQILYFREHSDSYMKHLIPMKEYHQIFSAIVEKMDLEFQDQYIETIGSLMDHNYNLVSTSESLFIHKNTLSFRLDKIKKFFHMNPIQNGRDREYMEYLYFYLQENRK
ncbi:MAG TPA: helix-turn-helix domain-containing protein [Candidatus Merdenecus merdavium]|nr:helix-turn-helix domain-containing protein [Candidatus Merdenecus merdavium]